MTAATDFLGVQARLQPDRLLATELVSGRRWTYNEFDLAVDCCASVLIEKNVGAGDRVASLAKNCAELLMLQMACVRLGAIYVPLNWRLSAVEIAGLLEDTEPSILFGDSCLQEAGLTGVAMSELNELIARSDPYLSAQIDTDLPSLILFTSGTSGRPKGALLSERNLNESAINFSLLGRVTHDSVVLIDSPMFHVIGLVGSVRPAIMRGATILISDGFNPGRTLQRLSDPELAVTHYFCVPQMAQAIRHEQGFDAACLKGLTALFTGGAPHPEAQIRSWLNDGIAAVDGYGMSEAGTVFGMPVDIEMIAKYAGSVGIASSRVHARLVNADGSECALGQAGELLLKGANVFSGYWRRPDATREAFTDDGWFHTGDIAICDENGFFWLVDRLKDMYISGGENVYPAEIEAALAVHPAVAECAVVGRPDESWGEVGHLFVVVAKDATLCRDEIFDYLKKRLAKFKLPKHLTILDTLPRNGAGKVLKNILTSSTQEDN
jgi:fatty-acyl-CoA synthase